MTRYRAVVVGCGLIGSGFHRDVERIGVFTHAGAYDACDRTELVGLCDPDEVTLRQAMRQWPSARGFSDLDSLLAETSPHLVSVCTPDATHASVLRRVLRHPGILGVFAEKPLAASLAEAEEIVGTAHAQDRALQLNYSRRFALNHQEAKVWLEAGEIGRLVTVRGLYTKGLAHNGSHWIDLARWLAGEIVAVQAFDLLGEPGPDPTLDLRCTFASGAHGTLQGVSADHFAVFEMDLIGTHGRIQLRDSGWQVTRSVVGPSGRYSGYRALGAEVPATADLRDVTLHGVRNLVAHLDDPNRPLACGGNEGVRALRVIAAARRSLQTGGNERVEGV